MAAVQYKSGCTGLAEADYRFVEQGNQLTEFESFMALSSMVTYTSSWLPANMITELQSARLPQGRIVGVNR